MSRHEVERHVDKLGELLAAGDREAELARAGLAECGECRELLELGARLDRLGDGERRAIETAQRTPVEPGAAERKLREHALASLPPVERAPLARRRLPALWLASAALLLALLYLWRRERAPEPDPRLGTRIELLHPVGTVPSFTPFRWSAAGPEAGWYRVVVQPLPDDGSTPAPTDSGRIEGTSWEPRAEDLQRWGTKIRWTVEVYRATGASDLLDSRSESAELSR